MRHMLCLILSLIILKFREMEPFLVNVTEYHTVQPHLLGHLYLKLRDKMVHLLCLSSQLTSNIHLPFKIITAYYLTILSNTLILSDSPFLLLCSY